MQGVDDNSGGGLVDRGGHVGGVLAVLVAAVESYLSVVVLFRSRAMHRWVERRDCGNTGPQTYNSPCRGN